MKRQQWLGLCVAASLGGAAQAAVQGLGFSFSPLQCTDYNVSPSSTSNCGLTALTGSFSFDDANGDGHIVLSELVKLTARAISAPGLNFQHGLQTVSQFDYSPATGLSFDASDGYRTTVVTGWRYWYAAPGGGRYEAWTPGTTLTIFSIPEPGRWLLLLAGGTFLAWRSRKVV